MLINRIIPVITASFVFLCLLVTNTNCLRLRSPSSESRPRLMFATQSAQGGGGGVVGPEQLLLLPPRASMLIANHRTMFTTTTSTSDSISVDDDDDDEQYDRIYEERVRKRRQTPETSTTEAYQHVSPTVATASTISSQLAEATAANTVAMTTASPGNVHISNSNSSSSNSQQQLEANSLAAAIRSPSRLRRRPKKRNELHPPLSKKSSRFFWKMINNYKIQYKSYPTSQAEDEAAAVAADPAAAGRTKRGDKHFNKVTYIDPRAFVFELYDHQKGYLAVVDGRLVAIRNVTSPEVIFVTGMSVVNGTKAFHLINLHSRSYICFDFNIGLFVPKKVYSSGCNLTETVNQHNNMLTFYLSGWRRMLLSFDGTRQHNHNHKRRLTPKGRYFRKLGPQTWLDWMDTALDEVPRPKLTADQKVGDNNSEQHVSSNLVNTNVAGDDRQTTTQMLLAKEATKRAAGDDSPAANASSSRAVLTSSSQNTSSESMTTTSTVEVTTLPPPTMTTSISTSSSTPSSTTSDPTTVSEWEQLGQNIFASQLHQYPEMSRILHHPKSSSSSPHPKLTPYYGQMAKYLSKHNELKSHEESRLVKMTEARINSGGPLNAIRHHRRKIEQSNRLE